MDDSDVRISRGTWLVISFTDADILNIIYNFIATQSLLQSRCCKMPRICYGIQFEAVLVSYCPLQTFYDDIFSTAAVHSTAPPWEETEVWVLSLFWAECKETALKLNSVRVGDMTWKSHCIWGNGDLHITIKCFEHDQPTIHWIQTDRDWSHAWLGEWTDYEWERVILGPERRLEYRDI